jgi:hypothetical protein
MSKIFIIAGGPSLRGFNFKSLRGHDCIAVNKSLFDVPRAKYFVTIDHSFLGKTHSRKFLQKSEACKFFVANYASGQLIDDNGRIMCTKTRKPYNLAAFDVIIRSRAYGGLGETWNDFRNGDCSGYCALQLAVLLGYTEIYLMGVDLAIDGNTTHYHEGYGQRAGRLKRDLARYYGFFVKGIAAANKIGVKMFSCSSISRLNDLIPFIQPAKALR